MKHMRMPVRRRVAPPMAAPGPVMPPQAPMSPDPGAASGPPDIGQPPVMAGRAMAPPRLGSLKNLRQMLQKHGKGMRY